MIENFDFGQIAIIGDVLLDCYINGSVSRVSPEAPVPVLLRAKETAVPGGAANVALNAATLGCKVSLIGLVGKDSAANTLRRLLHDVGGIDSAGLIEIDAWPTITKTRVLSGRQQIVRIDDERPHPGTSDTEARLIQSAFAAIDRADVLICSDYAKGVLSDTVLRAVIDRARARNLPVIVDPKRRDFTAYTGATLLAPNRNELASATGMAVTSDQEIAAAAHAASAQFGGDILVTRSEDGMTLFRRDGRSSHAMVRKSEVYDVSGAGDTVVATIASVLSAGQNLETAIVIATSAASIVVEKLGTATVSRAELSAALRAEMKEEGVATSLTGAQTLIEEWHRHGARVVFTNGCFDLLHPGHIALIRAAARQGDKLVVALNSDASVRRLKGPDRPIQNEQARAMLLGALRDVDAVLIFDEDTPLETIMALRPDVLVKGADYKEEDVVGGSFVKTYGGRVALVDLVNGQSTTSIVNRIGHRDTGQTARVTS